MTLFKLFLCLVGATLAMVPTARAEIFQWEYINPINPGEGKRQSTMLAPDGAAVSAVPNTNLENRNLTMAYLIGKDLANMRADNVNLADADLSQSNLSDAMMQMATLTNATFRQANLSRASFAQSNLSGADLSQANLTRAFFGAATLTGTNFSGAHVRGARLGPFISLSQLYSTASFQERDL